MCVCVCVCVYVHALKQKDLSNHRNHGRYLIANGVQLVPWKEEDFFNFLIVFRIIKKNGEKISTDTEF